MNPFDKGVAITGEWECMECGYIEEGSQARRPARCPECGAPANALEFFSYEDEEEEEDWGGEGWSDEEDLEDDELDDLEDQEWDDDER